MSTNAVVERVIKPMTMSSGGSESGATRRGGGKALIDTIESKHVGPKRQSPVTTKSETYFFVSHAWIQNFSVAGNEWRGGLVQAIVDSTP